MNQMSAQTSWIKCQLKLHESKRKKDKNELTTYRTHTENDMDIPDKKGYEVYIDSSAISEDSFVSPNSGADPDTLRSRGSLEKGGY